MKTIMIAGFLCFLSALAFGLNQGDMDHALKVAAGAQGKDYIKARDSVVSLGTNALPLLGKAANNPVLRWQDRLSARICYERINRAEDLLALRGHNWHSYEPYHPTSAPLRVVFGPDVVTTNANGQVRHRSGPVLRKSGTIRWNHGGGPFEGMRQYVVPRCKDAGLWYYYVEQKWKDTKEATVKHFDKQFDTAWPRWCEQALKDEPEAYYLPLVLIERLENNPDMKGDNAILSYRYLCHKKIAVAVPVLTKRREALFRRYQARPELLSVRRRAQIHQQMFEKILAFADSRHADLLADYIDKHPALSPLKKTLAEVRARPAPPPAEEPPFRLGTKLVVVK